MSFQMHSSLLNYWNWYYPFFIYFIYFEFIHFFIKKQQNDMEQLSRQMKTLESEKSLI